MEKRGVSPLIATILLVLIVVSIGAAVMLVLKGLTEESMEGIQQQEAQLTCNNVRIEILKISNSAEICQDTANNLIRTVTSNKGREAITDFKFTAIGTAGVDTIDSVGKGLAAGDVDYINFTYDPATTGTLRQITITPIIAGGSKGTLICTESSLTYGMDRIGTCN